MKKNLIYLLVLVLVVGVAFFFSRNDGKGSSAEVFDDFAVADTSQIHKVFIANSVTLERILLERLPNGTWSLNGEGIARKDRIETVLTTFDRAEVIAPVPKSELKSVNTKMAANNKKIMIYDRDDQLIKTWYLSHAIQSQQGTYALLEYPDKGKSSEPAIISMSGFRGYLGSRFATDISEWKSTEVFRYPNLNIKEIEVFRPKELHNSYKIRIDDFINRKFRMENNDGAELQFNPERLAQYITGYKGIYIESFRHNMDDAQQDSLRALLPDYEISVLDAKDNRKIVKFYYRPPSENHVFSGYDKDPEKLAGIFEDEVVSFQVFNVGKILATPEQFR